MADEQEEIEIDIKLEKAKGKLGDLKDELERLRRENGEITLGLVGSSVGAGLQSAAGQTGSSIASFVANPEVEAIKRLAEVALTQFFPQVTQLLKDGLGGTAVAGRVSPIAEQYARLTGQQLPQDVINQLVGQAQGPEQAAIRARGLVNAASEPYMSPLQSLGALKAAGSDDLSRDYQALMRIFWGAAPPTARALGGG